MRKLTKPEISLAVLSTALLLLLLCSFFKASPAVAGRQIHSLSEFVVPLWLLIAAVIVFLLIIGSMTAIAKLRISKIHLTFGEYLHDRAGLPDQLGLLFLFKHRILSGFEPTLIDAIKKVFDSPLIEDRDTVAFALSRQHARWMTRTPAATIFSPDMIGSIVLVGGGATFLAIIAYGLYSQNFLTTISTTDGARGFITFMIATTAVAVILLIAVSLSFMRFSELQDRFAKAKDLLAIIIGILGTILGFYYGSASSGSVPLAIADVSVPISAIPADQATVIRGTVTGGTQPYSIQVKVEKLSGESVDVANWPPASASGGSFTQDVPANVAKSGETLKLSLTARDSKGVTSNPWMGSMRFGDAAKPAPGDGSSLTIGEVSIPPGPVKTTEVQRITGTVSGGTQPYGLMVKATRASGEAIDVSTWPAATFNGGKFSQDMPAQAAKSGDLITLSISVTDSKGVTSKPSTGSIRFNDADQGR